MPNATVRRSDRMTLAAHVQLRRSGQLNYKVQVYEASPHGCSCEFVERPQVQERVWIRFDGLSAIEAEVRWTEGFRAGLSFVTLIHPAVFNAIVSRLGSCG